MAVRTSHWDIGPASANPLVAGCVAMLGHESGDLFRVLALDDGIARIPRDGASAGLLSLGM